MARAGARQPLPNGSKRREDARRRWVRVAWAYGTLLLLGLGSLSVIYASFIASLKTDPLGDPLSLGAAQLNPSNWLKAARLGAAAGGSTLLGGFGPEGEVRFSVRYFVPGGETAPPVASIPKRAPGSRLVSLRTTSFAADFATLGLEEVSRISAPEGSESLGAFVTYDVTVTYNDAQGNGRRAERLPLDLETPRGYLLVSATLPPDRIERRGRVASWDSVAPGALGFGLKNYVRAFRESYDAATQQSLLWRWTLNTFLFAFFRVLAALAFASMAGYALARLVFPGRRVLFVVVLFSVMVPAQVTFISNYLVLRDGVFGLSGLFGLPTLLDTLPGLVIGGSGATALVAASAVFIMKQFFESVPREIEEAARIDGAGTFGTFFRVVLPMAGPALGALTILTFQGAWNDFFWPLVVMSSRENLTLPVGLLSFRAAYGPAGDWGLILASAFFSMVPVIILFAVFQRYFVEGVSMSGLKG